MHEVRVYDSSGKLKKVISERALSLRSQKQIDNPSLFKKKGKKVKSGPKRAVPSGKR